MAEIQGGDEGSHDVKASAFTLVRFERDIFPFLQSRQWVPATGADECDRVAGAYDVVFRQGLLEAIRRSSKRYPEEDSVGLLFGQGCQCPWTRRLWVRVDSIVAEDAPRGRGVFRRAGVPRDLKSASERVAELIAKTARPGESLLGWYRTRRDGAVELDPDEIEVHARSFVEPWQFSMIVPSRSGSGGHGLFARDEGGRLVSTRIRPFYEHEAGGRRLRSRAVAPTNYRPVERAENLPGGSCRWTRLTRHKAPALTTAACTVFGVMAGLALSYELSRASQPGGRLSAAPVFASPLDRTARASETVSANDDPGGLVEVLDRNVERFTRVLDHPGDASSYCKDLSSAYSGVHAAFVGLMQRRDELASPRADVELAIQTKGRIDARFDRTGCGG